jgi:hypothetical protein
MPAPLEISEAQVVAHILYALRRERPDYRIPAIDDAGIEKRFTACHSFGGPFLLG